MKKKPELGVCHYCERSVELFNLRPYGPGGALVCYPCANATPERKGFTEAQMTKRLNRPGTIYITARGIKTEGEMTPEDFE